MNLSPDQQPIALREEFQKVWRRKFLIVGVVGFATILAIVLTLPSIWTPQYKSSAAFLPPNTAEIQTARPLFQSHEGPGAAYERDLDRFAGILNSDTVKFWMRKKFDLLTVYEIEASDSKHADKTFIKAYDSHVEVQVSRWALVDIDVYDEDPVRARDMTQALLEYANEAAEKIAQRRLGEKTLKSQLDSIDRTLENTQQELVELRSKYGTYELRDLPESAVNRLGGKLMSEDFHAHYDRMLYLQRVIEGSATVKTEIVRQIQQIEMYLKGRPTLISVVNQPVVNYEVVRPKRMVTVVLAFMGTLLVSVFAVLLFDKKQPKQTN